jgi:hypothetical protein
MVVGVTGGLAFTIVGVVFGEGRLQVIDRQGCRGVRKRRQAVTPNVRLFQGQDLLPNRLCPG